MSVAERFENEPVNNALTHEISDWLVRLDTNNVSERANTWAKHALLDWFGVTLAGSTEPLVDMLVEEYTAEAGGACTIVGRGRQSILSQAALINGAASHALDYDDVSRRLHGHPTVPVAPVVLALAEHLGASGRDVLTAFIVGTEIECLIGEMAGH
ncbi:MAG: MmgE/PrpD family protein, partial [Hyphomicrobiaceae bacterium]